MIHTARCNIPPPSQRLKLTRQPRGPAGFWFAPLSRSQKVTAPSCRQEKTFILGVPRVNVNEERGAALPGFYRSISASAAVATVVVKYRKRLTQTRCRQIRGVSNGMFTGSSIAIGLKAAPGTFSPQLHMDIKTVSNAFIINQSIPTCVA